jgi:hypothetical protein
MQSAPHLDPLPAPASAATAGRPSGESAAERQLKVAVGFSPRTAGRKEPRRVATLEPALGCGSNRSGVAQRRRIVCLAAIRGLKPTATIVVSLRETGRKCPNSSLPARSGERKARTRRLGLLFGAPDTVTPKGFPLPLEYVFSVLPASCRQDETMRDRMICRRDAGSTLERQHKAPLNR